MEKNDVIINSRGIRQRNYHSQEYRQRRNRELEATKQITSSDLIVIRIIICILISAFSGIILNSGSEKTEKLKARLETTLNQNISTEDLNSFKNNIINLKDKGISAIDFNSNEEISSEYIEEMNSPEDFYKNQKK